VAARIGRRSRPTSCPASAFSAGGVIFKERLSVSGLNTAATLWCTAAVGAPAGYDFFAEAAVGVVAIFTANVVLRPIVQRINRRPIDGTEIVSSYEVRTTCRHDVEERIRTTTIAAVRGAGMSLIAMYGQDLETMRLEKIVTKIGLEPSVYAVSWKIVPTSDDERELVAEA